MHCKKPTGYSPAGSTILCTNFRSILKGYKDIFFIVDCDKIYQMGEIGDFSAFNKLEQVFPIHQCLHS